MDSHSVAIFLSGPIGVGKSTLGRALANAMGGYFVEGDDHAPTDRPWYASALTTHRAILQEVIHRAGECSPIVIAYPLRCTDWLFYRRRLGDAGLQPIFVSLRASFENTTAANRGRSFSKWERRRIREMIEQGYAEREFSDLFIQTDALDIDATIKRLMQKLSSVTSPDSCHRG